MKPKWRSRPIKAVDRHLAWSVALIVFAMYFLTLRGQTMNPDAEVEFQSTSSLARTGSLALGGTPESEAILESKYHIRRHPRATGSEAPAYSWHGIGQAVVGLPFYWIGRGISRIAGGVEERNAQSMDFGAQRSEYVPHLVVGIRNAVFGALTCLLMVMTCRRLSIGRGASFVAGLSYGLTTFAWPQARGNLSDVQATFFLFAAFHALVYAREAMQRGRRARFMIWAAHGSCLAMALLTRIAVAPAVLVVGMAGLWTLYLSGKQLARSLARNAPDRRALLPRLLIAVGLPFVVGVSVLLVMNFRRFGSVFETGYGDVLNEGFFGAPWFEGVAAVLVSPGRGLLWMAPLVLLAPYGLVLLARGGERMRPGLALGAFLALLIPVAVMPGWHGGYTYGPRYLLPALPFLWMGVAEVLDRWSAPASPRWIAIALGVLGLCVQLPAVLVDSMTHQDLATQAARLEWPALPMSVDPESEDEAPAKMDDEERFRRIQWDWRFAAPWAHWRILRHRWSNDPELAEWFPADQIFFLEVPGLESEMGALKPSLLSPEELAARGVLTPQHARERGFLHLAWVDLDQRLAGPGFLGPVGAILLGALGLVLAAMSLGRRLL